MNTKVPLSIFMELIGVDRADSFTGSLESLNFTKYAALPFSRAGIFSVASEIQSKGTCSGRKTNKRNLKFIKTDCLTFGARNL